MTPGIYPDIDMGDYVHDRISPEPSLSTGVICDLVERSPLHAWQNHPRLGGGTSEPSARGDLGSAIHAASLGGAPVTYAPAEFDDWRKKDAQAFRDEARLAGSLPLLAKQRHVVEAAAGSVRRVLDQHYANGRAEMTLLWEHEGIWSRGRSDWLTEDGRFDVDVKSCESADPLSWGRRTMASGGYDVQAALRATGHEALTGTTRVVVFLLVEINPPFACSRVGVAPSAMDLARRKIDLARRRWRECMTTGVWSSYRDDVHMAEATTSSEWDFEARAFGVASL